MIIMILFVLQFHKIKERVIEYYLLLVARQETLSIRRGSFSRFRLGLKKYISVNSSNLR